MRTQMTNRQRAKTLAAIRKEKREHPRRKSADILKTHGISSASLSVWQRLEKGGVFARWPNRIQNDYAACAKLGIKHPYATKNKWQGKQVVVKTETPEIVVGKPIKPTAELSFEVNVTHRNGRVELVIDTTPETARKIMGVLAEK